MNGINGTCIEKEWDENGMTCVVVALEEGFRCGYVGVPKEHPLFGKDHDTLSAEGIELIVHGGLTYSACLAAVSDQWFFGFDCAHSPGDAKDPELMSDEYRREFAVLAALFPGGTIKSSEYAAKECKLLASQLKELS